MKLSKLLTTLGILTLLNFGKAKAQDIRPDIFYDSRDYIHTRTYVMDKFPKNTELVGFFDLNLEKDRTYNWYGEFALIKPMYKGFGPGVESVILSDLKDYHKAGLIYSKDLFGIYSLFEVYPFSTDKDGRSFGVWASKEFSKGNLELLIDRTFTGTDLVELQGNVKLNDKINWATKFQYTDCRENKTGIMTGISLKF